MISRHSRSVILAAPFASSACYFPCSASKFSSQPPVMDSLSGKKGESKNSSVCSLRAAHLPSACL
ncbi:hypothetical protein BDP55DRAFT_673157 [Colletotrichum godetiae]|uniref:Uncharacterized protein n=1 Tax=Colletotrichum godetiae TaxID=1209918 RepID=A0AAJ0AHB6_9PEZI|nr:uncharacterized protein BDP55DRAFT_673157 [Colletotrichum godetiae]KAK1672448.1 hypothetical protein BDP55DRAFT_673157 [Colletotrichum godetiae]